MKSLTDKLNLSLLELLSVLLPGALGLFFLSKFEVINTNLKGFLPLTKEWQESIGYTIAAYFIGYVFYVVSSPIDELFNELKRRALRGLEEGKPRDDAKGNSTTWWAYILFSHIEDTHLLNSAILPYKNVLVLEGIKIAAGKSVKADML